MGHEVPGKCDPAGARHVAVDHVQGMVHVFVVVRVPIVLSGDDLDLAPRGVPEENPDLFALGSVRHNPHSVRPIAEIGSYLGIAVGVAPASERPSKARSNASLSNGIDECPLRTRPRAIPSETAV